MSTKVCHRDNLSRIAGIQVQHRVDLLPVKGNKEMSNKEINLKTVYSTAPMSLGGHRNGLNRKSTGVSNEGCKKWKKIKVTYCQLQHVFWIC